MDKETIDSYNRDAEKISKLHFSIIPSCIYELIKLHFIKNGLTIDIGCGIGRDTNWLNNNGYPAIGIDASDGMLKKAKKLYPNNKFIKDELPDLNTLNKTYYTNILCSAVLMHLDENGIILSFNRLVEILDKKGCILLSFRGSNNLDQREDGKLYQPIDANKLVDLAKMNRLHLIEDKTNIEGKRNLIWRSMVFKR